MSTNDELMAEMGAAVDAIAADLLKAVPGQIQHMPTAQLLAVLRQGEKVTAMLEAQARRLHAMRQLNAYARDELAKRGKLPS